MKQQYWSNTGLLYLRYYIFVLNMEMKYQHILESLSGLKLSFGWKIKGQPSCWVQRATNWTGSVSTLSKTKAFYDLDLHLCHSEAVKFKESSSSMIDFWGWGGGGQNVYSLTKRSVSWEVQSVYCLHHITFRTLNFEAEKKT